LKDQMIRFFENHWRNNFVFKKMVKLSEYLKLIQQLYGRNTY
jgi:predicted adenine nucleotide alpha hydrolase (AANH) superfamily ATPase